ncbi:MULTISPECIES: ACP S-malonyltransferase [Helcobacillus]|uniref:Malonyl CoA-acyl carrier protein transacylase n=1 Tax=Helcobacillus massiliensis TaxID=521392 RepID=A0A839QQ99_9MICO|nr:MULTISPECIES: ACP S-malonyltransferase [Helcobacillus]MBB3022504.1 [acyl-carrier-protein] S-malonyltransferase [Helcobacillus massiliensis]MCG7426556.1 ACP S-malonyltransferase [Helcobacillus sp. ACRRO]MDK7741207.1 ACP S-malonyltransferase [Helcobacillus massiliensis]WOO94013.1 ACP S-malonyltransferase [Helcobacillus massiliensis]
MLVIASPGQGAQKPGFLSPWLELDSVGSLVDTLSDASGIDIRRHGTESDADTIRDTAVAQPLLVAASLITHSVLFGSLTLPRPDLYAGHSVGEIGAAAQAGMLSEENAMRLVAVRSQAMARAAAAEQTGMAAVVGGKREEVLAAIEQAGASPANINGAAQVVAAGDEASLAALSENPPARARVIPLQVAGAFHSRFMEPARDELAEQAGKFATRDAIIPVVSNADGSLVTDGAAFLSSLVNQVASTVDWEACMHTFADQGVTGILELAPAGTLTGLAKRDLKQVARFDLNTPDDLDAARAFVSEHASASKES